MENLALSFTIFVPFWRSFKGSSGGRQKKGGHTCYGTVCFGKAPARLLPIVRKCRDTHGESFKNNNKGKLPREVGVCQPGEMED